MTEYGVDFSYQVPTAAQIKAAGMTFVMRYLSWEPGKNISAAELASYLAIGVKVGFVWESTADRPLYGPAAGLVDGAEAGRQLDALGIPRSQVIFWALDTDPAGAPGWQTSCMAYHQAFQMASGHPALPYGSADVIDYFGGGWQTQAWSYGRVSVSAWLLQFAGNAPIAGTDLNQLFNSSALYPAGATPTPPVTEDWLDMATEAQVKAIVDASVEAHFHKWFGSAVGPGQKSVAGTIGATMGQVNANGNALKSVAGAIVSLKKSVDALEAK